MNGKTLATGLMVLVLGVAASAEAQVNLRIGGPRGGFISIGGGGGGHRPTVTPVSYPKPIGMPAPSWTYRNNRKIVTNPVVTHYDPYTGAIHTRNHEVYESANDYGRDESRNNGTMRRVNKPIYDRFGNLTGWERGVEWYNSYTGQRHHETEKVSVNNQGGWGGTTVVSTQSSRSVGSPRVNVSQTQSYGSPMQP